LLLKNVFKLLYIFFMKRPPVTSFPHSLLITGFVTRLTRRVSLVEQELPTLPEHLSSPRLLVGFVLLDLSFMCMFCRSLIVLVYFLFWSLCCLFFDIRILITPLVSSNSSHIFFQNLQLCNTFPIRTFYKLFLSDDYLV